ncbi:MAG: hypothetical protein ACLSDM_02745 [Butyricicoccus sp.]
MPKEAKRYAHELFEEINKDRESHGKQPFDDNNNKEDAAEPETVEKTFHTDPNVYSTRKHKKVLPMKRIRPATTQLYLRCTLPRNIHDSVAFDPLDDDICLHYPNTKLLLLTVPTKHLGSAKNFESGRVLTSAYTRP